jgi:cobalamin biosynthesis Mg chelatase CobN
LTEIKLVRVVDNDATRSEFLAPVEIKVSPENNAVDSSVNDTDNSTSSTGTNGSSVSGTDDSTSVDGVKDSLVSDDDGTSLTGAKNSLVDDSYGSWLSVGFWVAVVFLFVVVCGVGVFLIMKKRVNTK